MPEHARGEPGSTNRSPIQYNILQPLFGSSLHKGVSLATACCPQGSIFLLQVKLCSGSLRKLTDFSRRLLGFSGGVCLQIPGDFAGCHRSTLMNCPQKLNGYRSSLDDWPLVPGSIGTYTVRAIWNSEFRFIVTVFAILRLVEYPAKTTS